MVQIIDIGKEWYNLDDDILIWKKHKDGEDFVVLFGEETKYSWESGYFHKFSQKRCSEKEIRDYVEKNDTIWTKIEKNKDVIQALRACRDFYNKHKKALEPYKITKIDIKSNIDEKYPPHINIKSDIIRANWILDFFDLTWDDWYKHKIKILKLLAKKGTYEEYKKFLNNLLA